MLLVTWHFVSIFCASVSVRPLSNEFPAAGIVGLGFWLRAIGTIPVGPIPGESQVTPDGGKFFALHQVGSHGSCPVDVIDTATDTIITTVDIPDHWAKDILITPDSRFVYIANFSQGEVDVINTDTYR